jgi:plasmid stabilization system protein ParE
MDRTIRKYTSFDEMKADEYRYWQSRPADERLDAVEENYTVVYRPETVPLQIVAVLHGKRNIRRILKQR